MHSQVYLFCDTDMWGVFLFVFEAIYKKLVLLDILYISKLLSKVAVGISDLENFESSHFSSIISNV